jgi:hypothetical protein
MTSYGKESMKYSEKYKQELDEAVKEKQRLAKKFTDFEKKFIPLQEEYKTRMMEIIGLNIKIRDLRREVKQARFDENHDEDGMYIEGVNAWA